MMPYSLHRVQFVQAKSKRLDRLKGEFGLAMSDVNARVGGFEAFYRSNFGRIAKRAERVVGGEKSLAEDAAQDAMLAIWQNPSGLAAANSSNAWSARIVYNKAVDIVRRNRNYVTGSGDIEIVDPALRPDENAEISEEALRLREALSILSLEQRRVILLCYYESKSLSEIALIENCPENTVKTRLYHARMTLKKSGLLYSPNNG
jgi:RNA polymerase sigma-70 factor, ECF subfamily